MDMKTLNGKTAIEFGFRAFKGNVLFFLGVVAIVFVLSMVIPQVLTGSDSSKNNILANILAWLISSYAALGLSVIALRTVDMVPVSYKDFFKTTHVLVPYLIASAIASFSIALGIVLLVVPGLIIAMMWMFYPYLIIDKRLQPIEAFKQSMAITKGHRWQLFGIVVLLMVMNIVGALLLGVGLAVTVPVTAIATAHMYRQLV